MKTILKHTVLAGLFCITMATHVVANDVQVKIPESSLQIVIDNMIEARAFSFGSTSSKAGVNYYGYLPTQAVLNILPGNEFTLTITGKAIANFQLGPFSFGLSDLDNQVIVVEGAISIQNQGSGYKLTLIPDDFTDQTGNWLSGAINLASLLIKLPEISTSAKLPLLADATTSFFTSATPSLTTTENEVIFGYTLKNGPRYITVQNRVNGEPNIGSIQKVAGSTITTYDSPHTFEQNMGTSIQVQTPHELLDDAGEKHKYAVWQDRFNDAKTEIATRRIQYTVGTADETLSAVFDRARRIQLSNSLEGSLSGGTVTYDGTTTSSFDDYDYLNVLDQKTINSSVPNGTQGTNWAFWKWSDGVTNKSRNILVNNNINLQAEWKGSQISNDASAYANNSQRKVVRTSDGWLHMVYESLGRVWLEHSDDDGATWTLADNGNPLDTGAGKNPSIDWLYAGSTYGNYVVVVYQQKNGSDYKIMGKIFKRGSSGYYLHTDFDMGTVGSTESYSVDANPNITLGGDPDNTGVGDFTLTVEKKSGTAGIYYKYGELSGNGDIMSSSQPTHLSGTNANSTNTSVHINKMYNNLDVFHIVYQQGSGSIKYKFIDCDPNGSSWDCSNTYTDNLSSSTGQQNYKPSMVQMPGGGLKVSWIRALYGQSSPYWMNTVYWSSSSPSQYTIRGYFVRSVSLNVSNDNTKYLYAWSEQVNTYYANKLSNGSSTTNLSTSGEEVQLSNGTGSGANMLVSSFDLTSTPYAFKNTGNVGGSLSKVSSGTPINYGRGVALHKDDLRFNYTMKSLSVDNKNIKFVEIPQDKPDSAKSNRQWGVKYLKLKKLNKYILSEPFDIDNQTGISFSEEAGFIDRAQAVTVLGRKGYIRYKVELVDGRTNEVISLLNEAEYSAAHLPQDTLSRYIGNTGETTNSTARVKITISSNMDDLQGVLLSEYGTTDKEMLSKMAAKTLELTPAEEVTNYALGQNYPNPFNPTTQISYQLPEHSQVQLEVFDLLGRKVATLVNERQTTGRYTVTFDASHLASGVYLYRLTAGEFTESKKLFLIK